jgi:hypothetical protein
MFDVGSDDFIPPPPIFWHDSLVSGLYNQEDTLIGVRFRVEFADEFERTLIIHNELHYTDSILFTTFDVTVGQGSKQYINDVYGSFYEGPYYFRIYFGGLPIGYVAFLVQSSDRTILIIETKP